MLDDARAVPTFVQNEAVPEDIAHAAVTYLNDPLERGRAIEALKRFRDKVGNPHAPAQAAGSILEMVAAEES